MREISTISTPIPASAMFTSISHRLSYCSPFAEDATNEGYKTQLLCETNCPRYKKGGGREASPFFKSSDGSVPSTGQRRPGLPRAGPAVLSARWGLASGFGTGPGVPPMLWPLTGGRRPPLRCPVSHTRALGAAWRIGEVTRGHPRARTAHGRWVPRAARCGSGRARAISAARLRTSPSLHLPSIDQVVYLGPYRKEN